MFPKILIRSTWAEQWFGHRSSTLVRLCAALVLLAVCIAIINHVRLTIHAKNEITKLQSQTAIVQSKAAQLKEFSKPASKSQDRKSASDLATTQEQRRGLNAVIRKLNTPWQDLFDQLEKSTPKDVALLSIEPDAARASIRLSAEAKQLETLLTFASELQNHGVLGRLTYSKHETNDQDSNKPVRLSFELNMHMPQRLVPNVPLVHK